MPMRRWRTRRGRMRSHRSRGHWFRLFAENILWIWARWCFQRGLEQEWWLRWGWDRGCRWNGRRSTGLRFVLHWIRFPIGRKECTESDHRKGSTATWEKSWEKIVLYQSRGRNWSAGEKNESIQGYQSGLNNRFRCSYSVSVVYVSVAKEALSQPSLEKGDSMNLYG